MATKIPIALLIALLVFLTFPIREMWAGRSMPRAVSDPLTGGWAGFPVSSGKAAAPVLVDTNPTIAIRAKTPNVDAGTVMTGDFYATVVFTIEANREKVILFLEGSDLHKGGNPSELTVAPIPLNASRPAEIIAHIGKRNAGLPNTASWNGAGDPIAGFPSRQTETVTYESGQQGQFKQDVSCKVWYTQPVPGKPADRYNGRVKLTAMITP